MIKNFINQKNKKWILMGIGLVIASIVVYIVISLSSKKDDPEPDKTDPAYNLTKVFDSLGTKSTVEGYEDEKYNMFMKLSTEILGEEPSVCYENPGTDVEKNANVSQIIKQCVRVGLQNKNYYNVAAVSILYLALVTDINPADFEITKNKKGIVKFIMIKNPNDTTKYLTLSEFVALMLSYLNPNIISLISMPTFPITTPVVEYPTRFTESDDDDFKDTYIVANNRLNELINELKVEKGTETKINILVFSKIIALSISNSMHSNKCSIDQNREVVSLNGKKKKINIVLPTTMPQLRYKESKGEQQRKRTTRSGQSQNRN